MSYCPHFTATLPWETTRGGDPWRNLGAMVLLLSLRDADSKNPILAREAQAFLDTSGAGWLASLLGLPDGVLEKRPEAKGANGLVDPGQLPEL